MSGYLGIEAWELNINHLLRKWRHRVISHLPCLLILKSAVDVACGKHGAANGMGSGKGYVDLSTVDVDTSKLINGQVKSTGALFLEFQILTMNPPSGTPQSLEIECQLLKKKVIAQVILESFELVQDTMISTSIKLQIQSSLKSSFEVMGKSWITQPRSAHQGINMRVLCLIIVLIEMPKIYLQQESRDCASRNKPINVCPRALQR
ncbi:glyoxylate reductase (NADP(+)) [Trifolium repens]|nr:glyoxylate reductase (NADP(+)) [Trifolium repens]